MHPKIRRACVRSFHRYIRHFVRDGDARFLDTAAYPWARDFEEHHAQIREELEAFLPRRHLLPTNFEMREDSANISNDDRWKACILHTYRHPVPLAEQLFPTTCRLVKSVPDVILGFFSLLDGKKHILPHTSVYAGKLRFHMGIVIPEPSEQCRIRVCEETRSWQEGKSFIFDDSQLHEVWNDSDELRVILIVDFLRPLPLLASRINRRIWDELADLRYEDVRKNLASYQQRIQASLDEEARSSADNSTSGPFVQRLDEGRTNEARGSLASRTSDDSRQQHRYR